MADREPLRAVVEVELIAEQGDPGYRRLARWLKAGSRSYGLRCRRIAPSPELGAEQQPRVEVEP